MAKADGKKPDILVLWGDDIGTTNLSCYSDGLMGYETPHIDRLANEGLRFLHYYGEQSCTAGRAAIVIGQHGTEFLSFYDSPTGLPNRAAFFERLNQKLNSVRPL